MAAWTCRSAIAAAILGPSIAIGQTIVTGRISERQSGRPLGGARVSADGAADDTTRADGRYRLSLSGRIASTRIRIAKLGYVPIERVRTIPPTGELAANFDLQPQPLGLNAIVVTGSAGPTQVRSVGHSVSLIRPAELPEPVASIDHLLTSKLPGVAVIPSGGLAGSGAKIRLRGSASVALSNQPLVYIDGVRIRSDGYPKNAPQFGERSRGPNDTASPLNDIDASDIERIEIVRGPSATTLYGTEAAAGVIQIFTRRGTPGRTTWNTQLTTGISRLRPFGPSNEPYMRLDPWLRDAVSTGYSLSASGGSDVRYYLSGTFNRNEGVLPKDLENRKTVRGNFDMPAGRKLLLAWSSSLTLDDLSNTSAGPNGHGLTQNVYRGPANATGVFTKESLDRILAWDITTNLNHAIAGATATFTPDRHTSHALTVGYDRATSAMRSLRPFGYVFATQGILTTERWQSTVSSADYLGKSVIDIGEVDATIAWGAQSIGTSISSVAAYGEGFPGPSDPTIGSAAITHANETIVKSVIAGAFSQVTLGWREKVYLTAGLRIDGSSSFGKDFGLQPFPRASASWVISNESFWPARLGSMKLRAAYGEAGRVPGVFDASRTWSALSFNESPAYLPLSVGNSQLGPERSSETEAGFDSETRDGHFSAGFTVYRHTTRDALLPVQQAPSQGFLLPRLENVGTFRSSGIELALARVLQLGRVSFETGVNFATNRTKALNLGGTPDFILEEVAWIKRGQPTPVLIGPYIRNPDELAEPDFEENHVYGPNMPTRIVGLNESVSLPRGILLSARVEHQGGSFVLNNAARTLYGQGVNPVCESAYDRLKSEGRNALNAWERAWCVVSSVRRDGPIVPGDLVRLRDASLSLPLPGSVLRSQHATLTFAARNFLLSKSSEVKAFEPDMGGRDGMFAPVRAIELGVPTASSFSISIRALY